MHAKRSDSLRRATQGARACSMRSFPPTAIIAPPDNLARAASEMASQTIPDARSKEFEVLGMFVAIATDTIGYAFINKVREHHDD